MKVPPQEADGELLAQIGSHVQVSDRAYKVAVHRPAIAKQEPVASHFRTGNRFPMGAEDRGPLRLDTTQPVIGFRLFHGQSPFGAILPFRPKKAFPCHSARTRRGAGNASDLFRGDLRALENVARDISIGINGGVNVGYAVAGVNVSVPVGQGSAFYSGPKEAIFFRGCYELSAAKMVSRWSMRNTAATQCHPASVWARRS